MATERRIKIDDVWTIYVSKPFWPGYSPIPGDDFTRLFTKVSLISRHAGGEVRGYWLYEGRLYVSLPDRTSPWAAADKMAADALAVDEVLHESGKLAWRRSRGQLALDLAGEG